MRHAQKRTRALGLVAANTVAIARAVATATIAAQIFVLRVTTDV
jgi:hypothetical protein